MKAKPDWIGSGAYSVRNIYIYPLFFPLISLILYKYVHLKYLEIEFLLSWFISAYAAEYYA